MRKIPLTFCGQHNSQRKIFRFISGNPPPHLAQADWSGFYFFSIKSYPNWIDFLTHARGAVLKTLVMKKATLKVSGHNQPCLLNRRVAWMTKRTMRFISTLNIFKLRTIINSQLSGRVMSTLLTFLITMSSFFLLQELIPSRSPAKLLIILSPYDLR